MADERGQTKSEFVRESRRRRLWRERWNETQAYGRAQAERLGIGPEDVEDLVDEVRGDRA